MPKSPGFNALTLAVALSLVALADRPVLAQGTAFTYQGKLEDAGGPANGPHDLRFRLFAVATSGVDVGAPVCVDNVEVVDGVFTVTLDFGPQFATLADRYLEIAVRSDTGLSCGDLTGFVVLDPRQLLTATPRATHANSAYALDAADGSPANAVYVDANGNVGIGTTTPGYQLHIRGTTPPVLVLQDMASPTNQGGYVTFWNANPTETAWMGFGTVGSPHFSIVNARPSGAVDFWVGGSQRLAILSTGNIGIGTSTPAAALDVHGDIRLGSTGQLQAASSEEKLLIVRGRVSSLGGILAGSGFTASHTSTGVFFIDFVPNFASTPVVTCSSDYTNDGAFVAMTNGLGANSTGIRITTGGGTLADRTFNFIAIGPR